MSNPKFPLATQNGAARESGGPGDPKQRVRRQNGQRQTGWQSRGYLPHDEGDERTQHVTIHLADSLPKSAITSIEHSIAELPPEQAAIERRKRLHQWIDAGHGACYLRHKACAQMVEDALLHFADIRYALHAWVVMPNHLHVLFKPLAGHTLSTIVTSWKKFTGRQIGDWLRKQGREAAQESGGPGSGEGSCWHREWWDRYIRDERHFLQTMYYIEHNPVVAGLVANAYDWPWSSARERHLGAPLSRAAKNAADAPNIELHGNPRLQ